MRLLEPLKTLPKLVLLAALLMLSGCIGATKHMAIPNGASGQVLNEDGTTAFPDKNGKLEVGKYKPVPGDLIQRPRTQAEVVKALKDSGATFAEPQK